MYYTHNPTRLISAGRIRLVALAAIALAPGIAIAKPYVEFDFARVVACRDVTPSNRNAEYSNGRLVALVLPVSVRFHGVAPQDVDEIDIEINGAAAGLLVHDFSPTTQLASDVAQPIESTTTVKSNRSIDATLGGQLPVPYAKAVAHVAPSVNVGAGTSEIETEKMNRLPPKYAVVVSGTSSEGRGVFFKLKRSSQTSLEGVHNLTVVFVAPRSWRGDAVQISCSAGGRREVLWIEQPATLGSAVGTIQLHLAGNAVARELAERRVRTWHTAKPIQPTLFETTAAEMIDNLDFTWPSFDRRDGTSRASGLRQVQSSRDGRGERASSEPRPSLGAQGVPPDRSQ